MKDSQRKAMWAKSKTHFNPIPTQVFESTPRERELANEYKQLLDRDIQDYSVGIKNIKIRTRMDNIEKEMSNIANKRHRTDPKIYDDKGSSMDYFLGADPRKHKDYKRLKGGSR